MVLVHLVFFANINQHSRHMIYSKYYDNVVNIYEDTSFVDIQAKKYKILWQINNIDNFRKVG